MCHRYIQTSDLDVLRQDLTFTGALNLTPRHNIRPLQQVPVLHAQGGGTHLTMMRWGMTIPALRSDVVTELDAQFLTQEETGRPLLGQRCLIPADGFYECERRAGRRLQPWLVRLIEDGPFCFGGIWQLVGPSSQEFECTLLTISDSNTIAPIALQVPIILAKENYNIWLDTTTPLAQIYDLLKPYQGSGIYWHPVSTQILDTDADMPWLAEPAQIVAA